MMKYTLARETGKDKYERLKGAYEHHYKRTNGKEIKTSYISGFVHINNAKMRVGEFEKAMHVLRDRPDFSS